ncbi:MAG: MoaD/ThiS family protein [Methanothrix sp.]|jgi:sulfur carrier protein ThiS|uniref:MoaD/ThiS family protein n=2 Tax=Methanothrix sp. TaxID=90426 RepID=UPI002CC351BD|nr:thiamine S protein [Methanothrix sp.]
MVLSAGGGTGARMLIEMPDGSRLELEVKDHRIEDILRELQINSEEVIVAKNGQIVVEEETAGGLDVLKIVRIVHGG